MEKIVESYPLVPRPLTVNCRDVRGKLYINGSLEVNCLSLCFAFDDPKDISPLAVSVKAHGKMYTFYCLIRKNARDISSVETPLFQCPFCLSEKFEISAVEALVTLEDGDNAENLPI
jgi:hypothetical protein